MNAIQSLGKNIIVQPKVRTENSPTGFSTLLSALGKKLNVSESEYSETHNESELEEGDNKPTNSSGEAPVHLLMMGAVNVPPVQHDQNSLSKSLAQQGTDMSGEPLQVNANRIQEEVSLPGFTKSEFVEIEQVLQNEEQVLSETFEVETKLPSNVMKLMQELKMKEPKELLSMMERMATEPKQDKKLVMDSDQNVQLDGEAIEVQVETPKHSVPEGKETKALVEKSVSGEVADNQEKLVTDQMSGDEIQIDEKPEALPLAKGNESQTTIKESTTPVPARYVASELSEMITERMQLSKNGDETNIRIKLSPENLGQLDIRLTTSDGKVTAHIITATSGAKDMIESQLHQLRHTLIQQGIQLDKVEVVQQPQGSQQSFMQDGRQEQGQAFQQGKHRQGRKGEYELEENPLVTNEQEEGASSGINYAI
ncbi:flagellar hook-length control protein FliK [Pseudalkalibacillus sp. NRS-1564]|uniref:flagellar hook-length control protein FliK n=1 Tax=Pseudalkalibacillus sp. NRS-1564 TaxID=3233900 RepID=UPI003D2DB4DF